MTDVKTNFIQDSDEEADIGLSLTQVDFAVRMRKDQLPDGKHFVKQFVDDREYETALLRLAADEEKLLGRLDDDGIHLIIHDVAKALKPDSIELDVFLQHPPLTLMLQDNYLNCALHYLAWNQVDLLGRVPFRSLLIRNRKGATPLHLLARRPEFRERILALAPEVLELKTKHGVSVQDAANFADAEDLLNDWRSAEEMIKREEQEQAEARVGLECRLISNAATLPKKIEYLATTYELHAGLVSPTRGTQFSYRWVRGKMGCQIFGAIDNHSIVLHMAGSPYSATIQLPCRVEDFLNEFAKCVDAIMGLDKASTEDEFPVVLARVGLERPAFPFSIDGKQYPKELKIGHDVFKLAKKVLAIPQFDYVHDTCTVEVKYILNRYWRISVWKTDGDDELFLRNIEIDAKEPLESSLDDALQQIADRIEKFKTLSKDSIHYDAARFAGKIVNGRVGLEQPDLNFSAAEFEKYPKSIKIGEHNLKLLRNSDLSAIRSTMTFSTEDQKVTLWLEQWMGVHCKFKFKVNGNTYAYQGLAKLTLADIVKLCDSKLSTVEARVGLEQPDFYDFDMKTLPSHFTVDGLTFKLVKHINRMATYVVNGRCSLDIMRINILVPNNPAWRLVIRTNKGEMAGTCYLRPKTFSNADMMSAVSNLIDELDEYEYGRRAEGRVGLEQPDLSFNSSLLSKYPNQLTIGKYVFIKQERKVNGGLINKYYKTLLFATKDRSLFLRISRMEDATSFTLSGRLVGSTPYVSNLSYRTAADIVHKCREFIEDDLKVEARVGLEKVGYILSDLSNAPDEIHVGHYKLVRKYKTKEEAGYVDSSCLIKIFLYARRDTTIGLHVMVRGYNGAPTTIESSATEAEFKKRLLKMIESTDSSESTEWRNAGHRGIRATVIDLVNIAEGRVGLEKVDVTDDFSHLPKVITLRGSKFELRKHDNDEAEYHCAHYDVLMTFEVVRHKDNANDMVRHENRANIVVRFQSKYGSDDKYRVGYFEWFNDAVTQRELEEAFEHDKHAVPSVYAATARVGLELQPFEFDTIPDQLDVHVDGSDWKFRVIKNHPVNRKMLVAMSTQVDANAEIAIFLRGEHLSISFKFTNHANGEHVLKPADLSIVNTVPKFKAWVASTLETAIKETAEETDVGHINRHARALFEPIAREHDMKFDRFNVTLGMISLWYKFGRYVFSFKIRTRELPEAFRNVIGDAGHTISYRLAYMDLDRNSYPGYFDIDLNLMHSNPRKFDQQLVKAFKRAVEDVEAHI